MVNRNFLKLFIILLQVFLVKQVVYYHILIQKKKKRVLFAVVCFFIIYFFSVYVNAITTAKSVQFFQKSHKMESSIKHERILVNKKFLSAEMIPRNGGIVFDINELPPKNLDLDRFEVFMENKNKYNLDGFLYVGLDDPYILAEKYKLKVSPLILGSYKVAFPINKKKTTLLKYINESIQLLEDKKIDLHICSKWASTRYIVC